MINGATAKVAILTIVNSSINYLATVILAREYGVSGVVDAFLFASTIPLYLQIIIFGSQSFILGPIIIKVRFKEKIKYIEELVSQIIYFSLLITFLIAIIVYWQADFIIKNISNSSESGFQAAVDIIKICVWSLPAYALWSVTSIEENSNGNYLIGINSVIAGQFVNILCMIYLKDRYGIYSLSYGFLIGAIVQAIIMCLNRIYKQKRWIFLYSRKFDKIFLSYIKKNIPLIFLDIFSRLGILYERSLAFSLGVGSVSIYNYSNKLSSILNLVIGSAVATVIFKILTEKYVENDVNKFNVQCSDVFKKIWRLSILIALVIYSLSPLMIDFFYGSKITQENKSLIFGLMMPLIFVALLNIIGSVIGRILYVKDKALIFNIIGAVSIIFYFIFGNILVEIFGLYGVVITALISNFSVLIFGFYILKIDSQKILYEEFFRDSIFMIVGMICIYKGNLS